MKYQIIFQEGDRELRIESSERAPSLWQTEDGIFWIRWGVQDRRAYYRKITEAYELQENRKSDQEGEK